MMVWLSIALADPVVPPHTPTPTATPVEYRVEAEPSEPQHTPPPDAHKDTEHPSTPPSAHPVHDPHPHEPAPTGAAPVSPVPHDPVPNPPRSSENTQPPVEDPLVTEATDLRSPGLEALVPAVTPDGFGAALGHILLALLFAGLATLLGRARDRLAPNGWIPSGISLFEVLLRLVVVALGLSAVGALIPASIAPALPLIVMAAAVAVGWSARDILHDLVAGLFIAVEGQLRAGYWVSGEKYSGVVEAIGLRVTWLRDVHGRRIVVPNRVLLAQPLVTDDKPWPRIQFDLAVPDTYRPVAVREALHQAILQSPWIAPEPELEAYPDPLLPTQWHVSVRVLDSQYAQRFQGLLRERVDENLEASTDVDTRDETFD